MSRRSRSPRLARALWSVAPLACGCEGPHSALEPAGADAKWVADLFIWMVVGGAVVWLLTMGMALYAMVFRHRTHERQKVRLFIVGGGAVLPTIVLTLLLAYGLRLMPALLDHGAAEDARIEVRGERWWWRVRYERPDGPTFELANEIRLPVGDRTPLRLESFDVIHSLWVPALAGKIDLIPGRVTSAALEPTRAGTFRGQCAEYCGSSHAKMAFYVVAMEPSAFEAWVEAQREPARSPSGALSARGAALFTELGCGACHSIRGTAAAGVIGPDLTHVGSRVSVGAGILENDVDGFARWLARTEALKPHVHMPTFDMLDEGELLALASFLDGLR